jgi:hypothetical protein
MNLALWISAGLLAVVFVVSSSAKLFVPKEKLATVPLGDGPETPASASSRPSEPLSSWPRWAWSCPPRSTSHRFWCRWLLSVWGC